MQENGRTSNHLGSTIINLIPRELTFTCAGPETLSPRVLDVFVSIIPTLVEPSTSLSATGEFAFMVGSTLGTRDRRIPFGGNGSSGSSSSGGALAASTRLCGRLAFFASARSAGACPCRFWWSGGVFVDNRK